VLVAVALITLEPEAVRLRTLVPEAVAVTIEEAEIDAEGLLVPEAVVLSEPVGEALVVPVSDVEELGADVDELDAEGGAVVTADREASDDTELEAVAELVYEEELVLVAVALMSTGRPRL
jgi:hypothetical protein